jgi:hypothetical protein
MKPRHVPLISGLVCLAGAVCVIIFWPPPANVVLYWLRGGIFTILAWSGIWDLKVTIFATPAQIQRATSGDSDVFREDTVAAPSAFRLKDILFVLAALGALAVVTAIIGLIVRSFGSV